MTRRQGIVDGHYNTRQGHRGCHGDFLVFICIFLIALQLEGVLVVLDEHGTAVVVGNLACLFVLGVDVVHLHVAQHVGQGIATDAEMAVSAALLLHGERWRGVVSGAQHGIISIGEQFVVFVTCAVLILHSGI